MTARRNPATSAAIERAKDQKADREADTEDEDPAALEDPDLALSKRVHIERSPGFILAMSLALVFAIATATLAVLLVRHDSGDTRSDDVRLVAGKFGEALVTYDYKHPDRHRDAIVALATGSFRKEYKDAFAQGLSQFITEAKAVSQGYVKDVYVSSIDADSAEAIVDVDISHVGAAGPRTLYDVYFLLTLVEVDGGWKVDQVTDLNFASDTTATTAAPVP